MKQLLWGMIALSSAAIADHNIFQLEGEWYSSLFPASEHYVFTGLQPEGGRYVIRHSRGACLGSGVLDTESGKIRTVEVCPPKPGEIEDRVFINNWQLVEEHEEIHLRGGYYFLGNSLFREENLDRDEHGAHP